MKAWMYQLTKWSLCWHYRCEPSPVSCWIVCFHSLEARIANAISSFKCRKIFKEKSDISNIKLTVSTKNCYRKFNDISELLTSIFHSFEAGIANAISSFKWRKIFIFMKNSHLQYWINEASTKNYFFKFIDISIDLKHAWNRVYTVPAAQGLIKHIYSYLWLQDDKLCSVSILIVTQKNQKTLYG